MMRHRKPLEFDFCSGIYGFQAESMAVFADRMREEFNRRGICFNEIVLDLRKLPVGNLLRPVFGVLCRYFLYPLKVRFRRKTKKVFIADAANAAIVNLLSPDIKSIIFLHGLAYQEDDRILGINIDLKDRIIQVASRIFKRPGLLKCDLILTNSIKGKEDFLKFIKGIEDKRVIVAPLGVAPEFRKTQSKTLAKKLHLKDGQKMILSVAAPDLRKNMEVLAKALEILNERYENWLWVHIGGLHPWVEKNIDPVVLKKTVRIKHVRHEEMPQYYSLADVFVLPTLYDTFGWPPLEAAACECPVVVSDIQPLSENLEDVGIFINPANSSEISGAIHKVLNDDVLPTYLENKSTIIKERFSWERTGDIVFNAICEL